MKEMHRQGDIGFVKCDEIPKGAKAQKDGIIARGEVTGHTHRIKNSNMGTLKVLAGAAYLCAKKRMSIVHEEHNTINLPPGNWMVIRQREWTPEGWRQVVD